MFNARIEAANELAKCVTSIDGIVLDEFLKAPTFRNADYWFKSENVVAELKQLEADWFSQDTFQTKLSTLYAGWIKQGTVPRPSSYPVQIELQNLPVYCAREVLDPLKRKLEVTTVKEANKQIRETKKNLNIPSAKGLLILVNEGNRALRPEVMGHLLRRILKAAHSNIHSVIYFSANELVSIPSVSMPSYFWIDWVFQSREPVARELLTKLQDAWMRHYSTLIPDPLYVLDGKSSTDLMRKINFAQQT